MRDDRIQGILFSKDNEVDLVQHSWYKRNLSRVKAAWHDVQERSLRAPSKPDEPAASAEPSQKIGSSTHARTVALDDLLHRLRPH